MLKLSVQLSMISGKTIESHFADIKIQTVDSHSAVNMINADTDDSHNSVSIMCVNLCRDHLLIRMLSQRNMYILSQLVQNLSPVFPATHPSGTSTSGADFTL